MSGHDEVHSCSRRERTGTGVLLVCAGVACGRTERHALRKDKDNLFNQHSTRQTRGARSACRRQEGPQEEEDGLCGTPCSRQRRTPSSSGALLVRGLQGGRRASRRCRGLRPVRVCCVEEARDSSRQALCLLWKVLVHGLCRHEGRESHADRLVVLVAQEDKEASGKARKEGFKKTPASPSRRPCPQQQETLK